MEHATQTEIEAERPEFVFADVNDIPVASERVFDTLMVQALKAHDEKRLMAVHPEALLSIMNLVGELRRADIGLSDDAADHFVDDHVMAGFGFSASRARALFKGEQPPEHEPEVKTARRRRKNKA